MKKAVSTAWLYVVIFCAHNSDAQSFTYGIFGQNYWDYTMPSPGMNLYMIQNVVVPSSARVVRIGGTYFNTYQQNPTAVPINQIQTIVNDLKTNGLLPIVQLPLGSKSKVLQNASSYAASLIQVLNNGGNSSSNPYFTKYFSVGNEEDCDFYDPSPTADHLHAYNVSDIYLMTTQMINTARSTNANLSNSSPIVFFGPELTWYRNDPNDTPGWNSMVQQLTTGSNTNLMLSPSTTGCDFFTFHYYATGDQASPDPYTLPPTRADLIATLTTPRTSVPDQNNFTSVISPLSGNLAQLKRYLSQNPTGSGTKVGITEANICVRNNLANDGLGGTGANSFLAGQFWAEILEVAMKNDIDLVNFWSVIEGGSSTLNTNIGYWNSDPNSPYTQPPWSSVNHDSKYTYDHFAALAMGMRGTFYQGTSSNPLVKVFGSKYCGGYTVVILCQTQGQGPFNFVYDLGSGNNLSNPSYAGYVTANVNMGVEQDYALSGTDWDFGNTENLFRAQLRDEETIVITYDNCGNPIITTRIHHNPAANGDAPTILFQGPNPGHPYPGCDCSNYVEDLDPWAGQ